MSSHLNDATRSNILQQYKGRECICSIFRHSKGVRDCIYTGSYGETFTARIKTETMELIRDSYKHYQCAALIEGQPGTWFVPERGIHQGAPLSMPLYRVCINDLLTQLRDILFGAMIGEIDVTCPANADDIAIYALYKHGLNELLQMAYDYSKKWLFEFSPEKCLVMIWERDRDPNMNVYMGNEMLSLNCEWM